MIVKVIIKREVAEGKKTEFFLELKNLRLNAMDQDGYISGETLVCAKGTNKVLVISMWETLGHWKNWKNSALRIGIDAKIDELQDNPTEYEAFVFSKYKAAAGKGFPLPLQKQQL